GSGSSRSRSQGAARDPRARAASASGRAAPPLRRAGARARRRCGGRGSRRGARRRERPHGDRRSGSRRTWGLPSWAAVARACNLLRGPLHLAIRAVHAPYHVGGRRSETREGSAPWRPDLPAARVGAPGGAGASRWKRASEKAAPGRHLRGPPGYAVGLGVAPLGVAEVAARRDPVAHELLQLAQLGEAALLGARPHELVADAHLEDPAAAGDEGELADLGLEGREQLLPDPRPR